MDINLGSHHKKEKTLILVIAIIFAVGAIVMSFILGQQNIVPLVLEPVKPLEPKIDWELLTSNRLEKLQPLQKMPVFEDEIGRENPFLPVDAEKTNEE
jgi:LPS O-antigen subunit length determinant protein (WzzB/FepE family)